jgi:hypothetical protein
MMAMKNLLVASFAIVLVVFVPLPVWGDDDPHEYLEYTPTEEPSTNEVEFVAEGPIRPFSVTPLSSPAPSASFLGIASTNGIPPDTHGAVGPNHIMIMLNSDTRIQDRTGGTNFLTITTSNWWTGAGSFTRITDPRVIYDRYAERWVATMVSDPRATNSSLLFAISQSSDPTGGWYKHRIDVDSNNAFWADYPNVGFNKNWYAVSVNMGPNVGSTGKYTKMYLFNKTNVLTGGTSHSIANFPSSYGLTIVPAYTHDNTTSTLYCLQSIGRVLETFVYSSRVQLYKITGTPDSPGYSLVKEIANTSVVTANKPATTELAPQTNSTRKIAVNDHRIQNVVYRNGRIYGTQNGFFPHSAPTRSGVIWWRMLTDGTSPVMGVIQDSTGENHYAYPSIAVNQFNDFVVGYSSFSSTQYASASYTFRSFTDSGNRTSQLLKEGEDVFVRQGTGSDNRWGDYSATVVDPVNDTDFWTLQEYARPRNTDAATNQQGRYGIWWGKIEVSTPTNDAFANAISLSGSTGTNTGGLYRSTIETNEPVHAAVTTVGSTWFTWSAGASGLVTFDTLKSNTDSDTVLAIYTGTSISNLTQITANDDTTVASGQTTLTLKSSRVSFLATQGTTYRIALATKSENVDQITLFWIQPQAPLIVLEPENKYLLAGDPLILESFAVGTPGPTYQWRSNLVNLSGATYSAYTNSNPQPASTNGPTTYEYEVIASNSSGSATSRVAYVSIYPSATATHDEIELLSVDRVKFLVNGISNYLYKVQVTSDFITWTNLTTNPASFYFVFTNQSPSGSPYLFFRSTY